MIQSCQTLGDLHQLLENSHQKPVFLFKHSTHCPISTSRWNVFQAFSSRSDAQFWKVLVIQDQQLSFQIAQQAGTVHQSPQVLLFHQGKVVWHASHWSITEEAMTEALSQMLIA